MIDEFEDVLEQHTSLQESGDEQALQKYVAERKQHVSAMQEVTPASSCDLSGTEPDHSAVCEVATRMGTVSKERQAECRSV